MKIIKFNKRKAIIKCWNEISISDKSLIIIMTILLTQCIYNLFNPEPITENALSVNVIVRTSVASIFGYFLSENFLKTDVIKSDDGDIVLPLDNNINKENLNSIKKTPKNYICTKTVQILIAFIVCIISILSLILASNFNLIPSNTNPSVIQLIDLIGSCVGFLLGHSSNSSKKTS